MVNPFERRRTTLLNQLKGVYSRMRRYIAYELYTRVRTLTRKEASYYSDLILDYIKRLEKQGRARLVGIPRELKPIAMEIAREAQMRFARDLAELRSELSRIDRLYTIVNQYPDAFEEMVGALFSATRANMSAHRLSELLYDIADKHGMPVFDADELISFLMSMYANARGVRRYTIESDSLDDLCALMGAFGTHYPYARVLINVVTCFAEYFDYSSGYTRCVTHRVGVVKLGDLDCNELRTYVARVMRDAENLVGFPVAESVIQLKFLRV